MTQGRPSPDELLRQIESQERLAARGRLKLFLGYAPNVGKSDRMFDEAHRRRSRGQDVVVANWGMAIPRAEAIPSLPIHEISARRPEICVFDQIAHRNPEGSPRGHRWEDALALTTEGIHVIAALNLQHIAEYQDAVENITGRRAVDSVPLTFIQGADEIVLVDIPPDRSTLPPRQISELRELALLVAADAVENQLQRYMDDHGIHQGWGTQERVLVCITPGGDARSMLDSASRSAKRFHGQLLAVAVLQPDLNRDAEERLQGYLDYARRMDADVHVLPPAADPIGAIIQFAREHRVTQLFAGHTRQPRWRFWATSNIDRLIQASEGMDVRLFPHQRS